jgi:hypothetical protein
MKRFATAAVAVVLIAALARAQDKPQTPDKPVPQKPRKEHELLKQFEGEWEVRSKEYLPIAHESPGTETAQVTLGGFWLMFGYKGDQDGRPFEGHGMMGFDPQKQKYIGIWTTSWCPNLMRFEGQADAAGRVFTMAADGVDPMTGEPARHKLVFEITDKDHRVLRFYAPEKDGREALMGEMFYTRTGKKEAR